MGKRAQETFFFLKKIYYGQYTHEEDTQLENENQNHNEIWLHTHQGDYNNKKK